VPPADSSLLNDNYFGVPGNAAHPSAAKVWINYVLSSEGQRILYEAGFVDHPLEGSRTASTLAEFEGTAVKLTHFDVQSVLEDDADEVERMKAEF
jgi:ABC-type Fe3+ transport system substrate-binding protein